MVHFGGEGIVTGCVMPKVDDGELILRFGLSKYRLLVFFPEAIALGTIRWPHALSSMRLRDPNVN